MTVTYDQIKDYFEERVLQHVYAVARKDLRDKRGFYGIPKDALDTAQLATFMDYNLAKLHYVPGRNHTTNKRLKVIDANGFAKVQRKVEWKPARWEGVQVGGAVVKDVDEDWVVENFGQRFATELVNRAGTDFVPIPVGAVRASRLHDYPWLRLRNPPNMEYHQGSRDLCLFYSTASVLDYLGFEIIGQQLAKYGDSCEGTGDTLAKIKKFLDQKLPRWLQPKRLNRGYDWRALPDNCFATVILETTQKNTNHGVCITDNIVFDSNEYEGIRLNAAALHYCVDPSKEDGFHTIHDGWLFQEQGRKQRLKKMKSAMTTAAAP